ncbi:leucine-rich repeat protein [uncultured Robinsoniella sp.]|uniref:leucine-rich repeat protein n=1 Tax=uncultured Robinsoniella sp. TaxID=904190 RepID=UPI00374F6874
MKRWKQGKRIMSVLICATLISTSGFTALADNAQANNEAGQTANVGVVEKGETEPESGEVTEELQKSAEIKTEMATDTENITDIITEEIPDTEDLTQREERETNAVDQFETDTQAIITEPVDIMPEETQKKKSGTSQYENNQLYFDANGGTVNPDRKSVKTGDKYGELPIPLKEGYNFAGWSTDKIGNFVTSETVYNLKVDQKLYAIWRYEDFSSKWNYDVNEKTKTATLRKYIGSDLNVVVPNKVKISNAEYAIVVGKTGDRAKNGVFAKNRQITSVKFESGVKFEDNNMQYAFAGCSRLQSVTGIPDSVVNLKSVFQDCISMEKFNDLPQNKNIKDISSAFYGCTALKEVTNLPESATDLSYIFSGCKNLLEIPDIPSKAEYLNGAFEGCTSITRAPAFPASVKEVMYAFSGCINLEKAPSIPKKVKNIAGYLKDCVKVTSAPSIPSGVTNMEGTFSGCENLIKSPKIPSGVTNLNETFAGCKKLKNAPVLPGNVKSLFYTFSDCTSMEDAPKIPEKVRDLTNTFSGCESLKKAPSIPKGVKSLYMTFYNCKSLTKTPSIPSGVKEMVRTFQECSSLITVTEIPDSVTAMRYTFYRCSNLSQVYAISNNARDMLGTFAGCTSLRQAPDIPKSVYNMIRTFDGCVNLQGKLTINADLRKPIYEDAMYGEDDEIDGLEAYFNAFQNAGINGSGLTLDYGKNCRNISKIVESKGSGNDKVKKGNRVTIPSKMDYVLKFNGNGGKSSKDSKTIKYGSLYGTLPSAKRAGYEFKGWYTKKKGGSKITSDKKIKSAKNRTVYAQWTKVKVKKVSGISLTSTTKTQMVVSIKGVKGAKGHQILYATNSSFTKNKKTLNTGLLNKTVKKLKSGTRYYVKVRAYKMDSAGKRIYGSYSSAAKIKVK